MTTTPVLMRIDTSQCLEQELDSRIGAVRSMRSLGVALFITFVAFQRMPAQSPSSA